MAKTGIAVHVRRKRSFQKVPERVIIKISQSEPSKGNRERICGFQFMPVTYSSFESGPRYGLIRQDFFDNSAIYQKTYISIAKAIIYNLAKLM